MTTFTLTSEDLPTAHHYVSTLVAATSQPPAIVSPPGNSFGAPHKQTGQLDATVHGRFILPLRPILAAVSKKIDQSKPGWVANLSDSQGFIEISHDVILEHDTSTNTLCK